MRCAGCGRTMRDGDRCIRATASRLLERPTDAFEDALLVQILGGVEGETKLVYCLSCTDETQGGYEVEVYREVTP